VKGDKKEQDVKGKEPLTWVWNGAHQPVQLFSLESLVSVPIASNDMRSIFEYSRPNPVKTD